MGSKVYPGGEITSKYGNFKIDAHNNVYDSNDNMIARMERYGNGYIAYTGPYLRNSGTFYRESDGTWWASYFGDEGGKIDPDGTIWFMGQKITKVDLSQISPERVCLIYFYKIFEP